MRAFSPTSAAARVGVRLAVAAAFITAAHAAWLRPLRATIASHVRSLESLHVESSRGTSAERRLPALHLQVGRLQARLAAMRVAAPHGLDVGGVLRLLQARAAESGLSITAFKPSPPAAGESLAEWTVSLDVEGTYGSLEGFVGSLADDDVLLTLASFRIRAHDQPTDGLTVAGSLNIRVSLPAPLRAPDAPSPAGAADSDSFVEGCTDGVVDGPRVEENREALP